MTGERCDDCGKGLYVTDGVFAIWCDYCGDYHPNGGKPWREAWLATRTEPLPLLAGSEVLDE